MNSCSDNAMNATLWFIVHQCDFNSTSKISELENKGQNFMPYLVDLIRKEFRISDELLRVWEESIKHLWHLRIDCLSIVGT